MPGPGPTLPGPTQPLSGSNLPLTSAVYNSVTPTPGSAQQCALQCDSNGNLLVNVAVGGGGGGGSNAAAGPTGSSVPADADYTGLNVSGTLRGATGILVGSQYAQTMALVDGSGNQITSFGGGTQYAEGATSATATGTLSMGKNSTTLKAIQTDASGNLVVVQATAANLNATVTGTVGISGTVPVSGTFWQTTQPVSLTTLPALVASSAVIGSVKVTDGTNFQPTGDTSARTIHTTVDNSSLAVTGTFWQSTQPISIASAVTVAQATASSLNATVVGTGTFAVQSAQSGTWTVQPGNTPNSSPWLVSVIPATSGGWSTNVQQALSNTAVTVKSSAGQLGGYSITNTNTGFVYVFFYNAASPTVGSTTNLLFQIGIPASGAANVEFAAGIAFSSGIYIAASTSATSSSAPSTGVTVTTLYK